MAISLFGEERVQHKPAQMGMEDFAYYVKEVPGSFFWVGGALDDQEKVHPHHHPRFDVDEKAILYIGKLFIGLVLNYLSTKEHASSTDKETIQ
ncbi:metal-dependent amidase/aminoacylase/carboxypeptidase family protein [Bacillus thermophilus]|uniref:Metal-dependent amidase/aminoacylase/carboxypeptidase family protein n=1 Tax=Siminovitchia thermophila TaxID=1245522 RepID=A0ABS2R712_9BACI|nr:metal-dependent amidase/aminoacylase/carboxypeptidase family protein [Siminovitchia thermophila]